MKYLWRGASQPSCKELGFVRRRDHPCLNMSARLAKLLRVVSEMLPRSCTALARHETTPTHPPHPARLPSSPLMLGPSHQHCFSWVSPVLSIASLWLYLYHALFLSWRRIFSLSRKAQKEGWLGEGSVREMGALLVWGFSLRTQKTKKQKGAPLGRPTTLTSFCHSKLYLNILSNTTPSAIRAAAHNGKRLE